MQQGGKKVPPMGNGVMTNFDDPNPNTSIAGRSRTMMPSAYDAWKDVDEPLVKIPRFSFQEPSAGATKVLTPVLRNLENVKSHIRPRVNQLLDDLE